MKFADVQKQYLIKMIIDLDGDVAQIVRGSGLSRNTIYNMIRKHGLEQDLAAARLTRSAKRRRIETDGGLQ